MPYAADFVALCLKQAGDRYVYGAEVRLDDPDPKGPWDCSELVQWGTARVGAPMPDGSANQLAFCVAHGTEIAVQDAINRQGALLFIQKGSERHVAVSLGNGETIEARGKAYGVGSWPTKNRPWTHGALVPGLVYDAPPPAPNATVRQWPGRYIKRGMTGTDVLAWQRQMRARGWNIAADAAYGPASEKTCIAFQREKHLKADGIVGPDTWKAAWAAPIS